MMSHKERVLRAIRRESLDFFPSQVDFTPNDLDRIARGLGVAVPDIDEAVDNHLRYAYSLGNAEEYMHDEPVRRRAQELGVVRVDEGRGVVYDIWGVGWDLHAEGVWICHHPISNPDRILDYPFPDPDQPGLMDYAERLVASQGQEYFIVAFQHISLFERAWALLGFENLMIAIAEENPDLDEFFGRIGAFQTRIAKRFIACGVDGVRVGDDYGSQDGLIISPEKWRRYIKPNLRKLYSAYQAAGLPVFQHSCGDLRTILDDFLELKLDVLHPLQPKAMPLEKVEEILGGKICFFGGIDTQELLPFRTPAEVREGVLSCVRLLGKRGGYLIAPSQEVMSDVPIENIRSLVTAIRDFREMVPRKEPR
jgi:uroporphyrinogen decarboxylase